MAGDLVVPVMPSRRVSDATPLPPPPLPPGADRVRPLTLEIRTTTTLARRQQTGTQTVTRVADRVQVVGNGTEWMFERNPVDPRRASAVAVYHATKTIVVYNESDLRTMLGIPGWAHVLTMGVDARALVGRPAASAARTMAGLRFTKMAVSPAAPAGDVWWNAEYLLPLEYTSPDGRSALRITRLDTAIDLARLTPPEFRYPTYRVVELADWLEEH